MVQKTQLLKGLLEGCILKIISEEVTYGYAICEDLVSNGFHDVNEGTVYPILIRLEKKKLIVSEKRASALGPQRKYFSLTAIGEDYLQSFIEEWENVRDAVDTYIK